MLSKTYTEKNPAYAAGWAMLFLATAVIGTALAFEHLGGYVACPLCLQERWAYYSGIPALCIALVLLSVGRPNIAATIFLLVALAFLANAGLGAYHSGVEWKFWPGPATCSGATQPFGTGSGGLLKDLASTRVIRCDEAPWHFAGLSLAGWNTVMSLLLAITATYAALRSRKA